MFEHDKFSKKFCVAWPYFPLILLGNITTTNSKYTVLYIITALQILFFCRNQSSHLAHFLGILIK